MLFTLLHIYNNYRVTIVSCKRRDYMFQPSSCVLHLILHPSPEVKDIRDDCVFWEELSCRADGEGAEVSVDVLVGLRSVSRDHICLPDLE